MSHRLDPLLRPALDRGPRRDRAPGHRRTHRRREPAEGRFRRPRCTPSIPATRSVCGVPCFPSLAALPDARRARHLCRRRRARRGGARRSHRARRARGRPSCRRWCSTDDREPAAARARRAHGSARRPARLRRQRHGLLQFPRRRLGLRLRDAHARAAAATSRYISHSGSGHVRHRRHRRAPRLQPGRLHRPGTRGRDGRVSRLRAGPARDPRRRPVHGDRAQSARACVRALEKAQRPPDSRRCAQGRPHGARRAG